MPGGVRFLTHAGIELSVQRAHGIALVLFGVIMGRVESFILRSLWSSAQQGRVVREGRLIKVPFPKLLLHEELVSSSSHAVPTLGNLWGIAGWALTISATAKASDEQFFAWFSHE